MRFGMIGAVRAAQKVKKMTKLEMDLKEISRLWNCLQEAQSDFCKAIDEAFPIGTKVKVALTRGVTYGVVFHECDCDGRLRVRHRQTGKVHYYPWTDCVHYEYEDYVAEPAD